jgi:hypothetical protein
VVRGVAATGDAQHGRPAERAPEEVGCGADERLDRAELPRVETAVGLRRRGGVGIGEAPDAAALLGRVPLVLSLGLCVALRGLLGLSHPLGRVPGLRLACAGVVGEAARLVLGARDGVGQHGGAEHRGVERGLRRHDRRGHHGRDRRRHRTATLRGQVQLVGGASRDVRCGAGQRRRAAGDGDGRHGGDADTAQDGRGQGWGDRGCMRRAAGPGASRTPEQREREGRERAAASGGAMPSHDQPSGSDGGGWTSGWGGRRVGSPVSIA